MNALKILILSIALSGSIYVITTQHRRSVILKKAQACVDTQVTFCRMLEHPGLCNVDQIINMCVHQ